MWEKLKKLIKFLFAPKCLECNMGKFEYKGRSDYGGSKFICDYCGFTVWTTKNGDIRKTEWKLKSNYWKPIDNK